MMNEDSTPRFWPAAMVNVTNKCTLRCKHCFVFREGNPTDTRGEMDDETMIATLKGLQERHKINTMLWMGGEPLLRPEVLREGVKIFRQNNITTNGTLDLIDLPRSIYIVSLDGPPEVNDEVRGKGSFDKVMRTLGRVPENFGPTVMVQCVVTKKNQESLAELVEILRGTRAQGLTFSFYVPRREDDSGLSWGTLTARDEAVNEAMRLKVKHPDFIWNNRRSLELTLSPNAKAVTDNCPSKKFVLPLYLDHDKFVQPFCCYGNDVDCDLCGAWVVFYIAAKMEKSSR